MDQPDPEKVDSNSSELPKDPPGSPNDDSKNLQKEHLLKELLKKNQFPSLDILFNFMINFSPPDDFSYGQEITDHSSEVERCKQFGFTYDENRKTRRRIFYGSLIADESWHTILAHAVEAQNLYHTVALIESNTTTDGKHTRKQKYKPESIELRTLQSGIFGPTTNVTVDFYVDHPEERMDHPIWNGVEFQQRDLIIDIWKQNGMTQEDIGIVGDFDEMFSRDFLLAAQSCDVPLFRAKQDCKSPKILGQTMVFEASPSCFDDQRVWFHPDIILGECIEKIGDSDIHKPGIREWGGKGPRREGYGEKDYSMMPNVSMYPLWKAEEFRTLEGGAMVGGIGANSFSAFHLHNFFDSIEILRNKYVTYSHPDEKFATIPLGDIHEDINLTVTCIGKLAENHDKDPFTILKEGNRRIPILFNHSSDYVKYRNKELMDMIDEDQAQKTTVMGLAIGYGLDVFKSFVGSLRATGYSGNIILGVSHDMEDNVAEYLKQQKVMIKPLKTKNECTYTGSIHHGGSVYNHPCLEMYPDYKLSWGRFALYRDWLKDCSSCTEGIMLTDVRDAFFQRDPFDEKHKIHPLMFFEEHESVTTTHWLTDFPVSTCRNYTFPPKPMLCSGSIMGLRDGILDYIDVMIHEFDYWKQKDECSFELIGDDQSIHNYLYYTNQLKNAVTIPHRTGPIHVIGVEGDKIFRLAEEKANEKKVSWYDYYVKEKWQNWLPAEYNLIDPETGLILNADGSPSPQVHQFDRIQPLMQTWMNKMKELNWPYNKDVP